jgi:hypothetical protein
MIDDGEGKPRIELDVDKQGKTHVEGVTMAPHK